MEYDDDDSGPEVILIAEGHDALQGSLKDLVLTELPDACVLTVRSGKEAVKLSLNRRPAAVILDSDLPKLSGVEATRKIHAGLPDKGFTRVNLQDMRRFFESFSICQALPDKSEAQGKSQAVPDKFAFSSIGEDGALSGGNESH